MKDEGFQQKNKIIFEYRSKRTFFRIFFVFSFHSRILSVNVIVLHREHQRFHKETILKVLFKKDVSSKNLLFPPFPVFDDRKKIRDL